MPDGNVIPPLKQVFGIFSTEIDDIVNYSLMKDSNILMEQKKYRKLPEPAYIPFYEKGLKNDEIDLTKFSFIQYKKSD